MKALAPSSIHASNTFHSCSKTQQTPLAQQLHLTNMDYHALQHHQSYQNQTKLMRKILKLAQKYEKYMLSRQSMSHHAISPKLKLKQEFRGKFSKSGVTYFHTSNQALIVCPIRILLTSTINIHTKNAKQANPPSLLKANNKAIKIMMGCLPSSAKFNVFKPDGIWRTHRNGHGYLSSLPSNFKRCASSSMRHLWQVTTSVTSFEHGFKNSTLLSLHSIAFSILEHHLFLLTK